MTDFSGSYQEGYIDGMRNMATQVGYVEEQMGRLTALLMKAVMIRPASSKPKPGLDLWLILAPGIVTTGFYLNKEFIADSGMVVSPTHWCVVPPILKGNQDAKAITGPSI